MSNQQTWENYKDFVIKVTGIGQGTYQAHARGPAGEADTTFNLPFDQKDLEIFLLKVGGPRRTASRGRVPKPMKQTVDFGSHLFDTILGGPVRETFATARQAADEGGYGLRLRLHLSETPELFNLPWEYLYDGRDFLALSDTTPVMRYFDLPDPPRPVVVDLPLRILVTVSGPLDQVPIDIELEKVKIREALAGLIEKNQVEIIYTEDATLTSLQRTLRAEKSQGRPFHIWHYIGHGAYDPSENTSLLVFCDEFGMSNRVGGFELGTLFKNYPETRLALLNACEGARTDSEDPFAGVATALVERGIPAVIGMQFEISDQAAITFSGEFYSALVDGLPVDAACTNARRAVFFLPNFVEWATPVLYMRSPDGRLFDFSRQTKAVSEAGKSPGWIAERTRDSILPLYTDANEAYWLENWEKAVTGFQSVVEQRPDYQDAQEKLEFAQRQLRLSSLYREALDAEASGDWGKAQATLEQIITDQPDFKDTAEKLEKAKRQMTLADLYSEARALNAANKWEAVIKVMAEIAEIDPNYPDPDLLARSARVRLSEEEHLKQVDDLYGRALHAMDQSDWQIARDHLLEIQELKPGYKKSEQLLARMEAKFDPPVKASAQELQEPEVPERHRDLLNRPARITKLPGLTELLLRWWRVGLLLLATGYHVYLLYKVEYHGEDSYVQPWMLLGLALPFCVIGGEYLYRKRRQPGVISLAIAGYFLVEMFLLERGDIWRYGFTDVIQNFAVTAAVIAGAILLVGAGKDAYLKDEMTFFR